MQVFILFEDLGMPNFTEYKQNMMLLFIGVQYYNYHKAHFCLLSFFSLNQWGCCVLLVSNLCIQHTTIYHGLQSLVSNQYIASSRNETLFFCLFVFKKTPSMQNFPMAIYDTSESEVKKCRLYA